MFKLMLISALSIGLIQYASAVCHACNENSGVACISLKEFHPCFGGVPDTTTKYTCLGEDEVCTKFARVCMNTKEVVVAPACGDTSNCGKCGQEEHEDGMFTCTSRTTFTMCFDGELSDIRGTCPENQICDISLGKQKEYPCVPACKEPEIEFCDLYDAIDVPVTTTQEPATTTELPTTTTTTELPTTTKTTELPTTTTGLPTTTTEKIPENVPTTTEEISTTTIFAPTPAPPVTTTTQQATTTTELPTTTENPAELVCSQQTAAGRYPYPNDTTCKRYIYCFRKGGVMQTTFLECPNQLYFNPSTSLCGEVKPEGCV